MGRKLFQSQPQRGRLKQNKLHFHFLLQPLLMRQPGGGYCHRSMADIRSQNRVDHSLQLPQFQAMTLGKIGHCKCKGNNKCVNSEGRFIKEDTAVD